eukprot:8173842-Alexandrium_andersonii.AAC.1
MPPAVQEPAAGLPATARGEDGARCELGADAEASALKRVFEDAFRHQDAEHSKKLEEGGLATDPSEQPAAGSGGA